MIFGLIFSTYNLLIALGVPLPRQWEIASVTQAIYGMGGSFVIFVVTSLLTRGDDAQAIAFIKQAGLIRKRYIER